MPLTLCKNCQFTVIPKVSALDQAAIMHGFCSDVCRKLYEKEKALPNKAAQARQGGL